MTSLQRLESKCSLETTGDACNEKICIYKNKPCAHCSSFPFNTCINQYLLSIERQLEGWKCYGGKNYWRIYSSRPPQTVCCSGLWHWTSLWTDIPWIFLLEPGLIRLVLHFRWPQPKDEKQPNSRSRPLERVQRSNILIVIEVLCNITFNIF